MEGNMRRDFIRLTTAVGASFLLQACGRTHQTEPEQPKGWAKFPEEEVSPAEDLMREHGVLDRVLLVYEEGLRRLGSRQEFDPAVLVGSAQIIRRFIEDYHEKLE